MKAVRPFAVESLENRCLFDVTPVSIAIDTGVTHQTISGFGAGMVSWTQKAEYRDTKLYDNIVGDMGASAARASVWPTFEKLNDNNDPNVFNWAKFDTNSLANTMRFFQQVKARGASTFILSVWTPPAWMKTNQAHDNGGQLRPDDRAEFAEYLAAYVIRAKQAFDIDITAISIQNEPFLVEPYESTLYSPAEMRETVRSVTRKFAAEGLATSVLLPEEVFSLPRFRQYAEAVLNDPELRAANIGFAAHYMGPAGMASQKAIIGDSGKLNWYTENGNRGPTWSGGLAVSVEIDDALRLGDATAYLSWQFAGSSATDKDLALVLDGKPNAKYYAMKHYARYVRPGAVRVDSTSSDNAVRVTAFKNPTNNASTIVLTNTKAAGGETHLTIDLQGAGLPANFRLFESTSTEQFVEHPTVNVVDGKLEIDLPASSIVTLYNGPEYVSVSTGTGAPATSVTRQTDAANTYSLREAAMDADLPRVISLLSSGYNANLAYSNGWTSLFTAAASPYAKAADVVNTLLNAGANPQLKDVEGLTALHVAASNQIPRYGVDPDIARLKVQLLLNAGINVNTLDNLGRTPLHYAAMMPKIDGDSAGMAWNTTVLQALIAAGADKDLKDSLGKTALDYARQEDNTLNIDLLSGQLSLPTISGFVYIDKNQNGKRDSGDVADPGVMIFLDNNGNGFLDDDEETAGSDANGFYKFFNVQPGRHELRPFYPSERIQINPLPNVPVTVSVVQGQNFVGADFGSVFAGTGASIRGVVFDDEDSDGQVDAGEQGRALVTVFLDVDSDGLLDDNEEVHLTEADGSYLFENVQPDTAYTVRVIVPTGDTLTTLPVPITLVTGQLAVAAPIGMKRPTIYESTISGTLFLDADRDGQLDAGETSLSGRNVFVDLDNDGNIDYDERSMITLIDGSYSFDGFAAGTYVVRQVVPAGQMDFTGAISIVMPAEPTSIVQNFGSNSPATTPPPTGPGSISGLLFGDSNNDGVRNGTDPVASARVVWIDIDKDGIKDSNEPSATSNVQGVYTFSTVAAGTYQVRRVFPSGYRMSGPSGLPYLPITVAAGQKTTNADIGSTNLPAVTPPPPPPPPPTTTTASIAGILFGDSNNNGVYNTGEALAASRRVWIDLDLDGKRDTNEPTIMSDSKGVYKLTSLAAGTYRVRREFPSGYRMSGTGPGYLAVTVAAGQAITTANIGSTNAR